VSAEKKVHSGEAVHLQVDETGSGNAAPVGGAQADAGDAAVGHLDVARHQAPVDERCPDSESHGYPATGVATGTSTLEMAAPVSRSKKWRRRGSIATSTASPGARRRCRSKRPRSVTDRSESSTPREGTWELGGGVDEVRTLERCCGDLDVDQLLRAEGLDEQDPAT